VDGSVLHAVNHSRLSHIDWDIKRRRSIEELGFPELASEGKKGFQYVQEPFHK
jgi:hypothetical protein